jgi:hypothetical protein
MIVENNIVKSIAGRLRETSPDSFICHISHVKWSDDEPGFVGEGLAAWTSG